MYPPGIAIGVIQRRNVPEKIRLQKEKKEKGIAGEKGCFNAQISILKEFSSTEIYVVFYSLKSDLCVCDMVLSNAFSVSPILVHNK